MKNVLITGINGSGPSYLAEFLLKNPELKVFGLYRYHSESSNRNLINIKDKVLFCECDLCDLSSVIRTLEYVKPDFIFHMASTAKVKSAFISPISVLRNNIESTINLLEAVRILQIKPVIHYAGTSECYGQVKKEDIPIKETHPINPANVYAISKLTQEKLMKCYFNTYGIQVVLTRAFTYINPRRPDIFSTSFVKQIVDIENKRANKLFHGNLSSIRTIIDVRDIVEGYWESVIKCERGEEYNIGGNAIMSVGDFLDLAKKHAYCNIETEVDESLLRPVDVTLQIPDTKKFYAKTNWKPKIDINDSIKFLFDYFRKTYE